MKLLHKLASIFDRVMGILTVIAVILLIFVMLSVCLDTILRYFWNYPIVGVNEISEQSMLYITFLGAAWLLKREGHVCLDTVVSRLNGRTQALMGILTSGIGAVIFLVIFWYGSQATSDHWLKGIIMVSSFDIPSAYSLIIIPIGSFLLSIQFLRRSYKYFQTWRTIPKPSPQVIELAR